MKEIWFLSFLLTCEYFFSCACLHQINWLTVISAILCQKANITTILTKADATSIAALNPTVYGSLVIGPDMTGAVELEGIKMITGDLICGDLPELTGISSSTLSIISGSLELRNLTSFSNLEFPSLEGLDRIEWQELPALFQPILTRKVKNLSTLYLSYTNLANLDKITPPSLVAISVHHNPLLRTFSIPLASNGSVDFDANAQLSDINLGNPVSVDRISMYGNFTS